MHKVKSQMNNDMLIMDGISPQSIQEKLDSLFVTELGLSKNENEYLGDDDEAWSSIWAGISICKDVPWFKKYIKVWEYWTNVFSDNPNEYECEDLISEYKKLGAM